MRHLEPRIARNVFEDHMRLCEWLPEYLRKRYDGLTFYRWLREQAQTYTPHLIYGRSDPNAAMLIYREQQRINRFYTC